ncbi:hypothetical protein D3C76_912450 [compost metagenome]
MKLCTCEKRHEHLPYGSIKGCARKLYDFVTFLDAKLVSEERVQISHALMSYHDPLWCPSGA